MRLTLPDYYLRISRFRTSSDKMFNQEVIYDWEPDYCEIFLEIGHDYNKAKCKQPIPKADIVHEKAQPEKERRENVWQHNQKRARNARTSKKT